MTPGSLFSRRRALGASISMMALLLATAAQAQTTSPSADIGSVDVQSSGTVRLGLPPLTSQTAVGSKAPAGSAPALAPAQGSLDAIEPVSIVSDKIIRDVIPPSADYNEAVKYTPGYISNNVNGLLGDSKGGWRGYADGQYNITFDGVPFGDANDPTHHSAAYFPGAFLGTVTIDRGPGPASQVGYSTFGGTMALRSVDLSDNFGGRVSSSWGSFDTHTSDLTMQTGKIGETGVRALFQYHNAYTAGAINFGKYAQNDYLMKVEKQFENVKVTLFSTYGLENYNNVNTINYPQLIAYGRRYGQVNGNKQTEQYVGYNNSQKQTDMEYLDIEANIGSWRIDNKVYTYSYTYPALQNNGADQTIEGIASIANGASITSVKIPTITGGSTKVNIKGVANGDVVGYVKYNNYRAFGDVFKAERDISAGMLSGTFRTGLWVEQIDNGRFQEYINYSTGVAFPQSGNSLAASYKLNLDSRINSVQPFAEYEWRPIEGLAITPGVKIEGFRRDHNAIVNQTTLAPLVYSHTYTNVLPFLSARYKVTPEITVYGQASQGVLAPTVSAYYVFNPQTAGIKAQTTTNYQIGAVYKNERITADIDLYQVTANNFPIVTSLSTGEQVYTNGGTAQYRGAEIEGSYSVANGFSAYASAALISAKFIHGQFSGLRVGDAPDYTLVGGAIYDDGMFFGSLLQKFVGDAYGSSGQKAASATTKQSLNYVKGYNTTDLVVGMRSDALKGLGYGQKLEVKLGVYNVFNHRNITEIGGDPTGLTNINNTKLTYSFLPGRLIYGSLGVSF